MKSIVLEKSYQLSFELVTTMTKYQKDHREYDLTRQLIRSITSITANLYEAQGSQTNKDFLTKISISLKEALESQFWLRLFHDLQYIDKSQFDRYQDELTQIIKMLSKIRITLRAKL